MQGSGFARPGQDAIDVLRRASTATLQTILRRQGVFRIWMPLHPLQRGMCCVGTALTIRGAAAPCAR